MTEMREFNFTERHPIAARLFMGPFEDDAIVVYPSGHPDGWVVVYQDAYETSLTVRELSAEQIMTEYGIKI